MIITTTPQIENQAINNMLIVTASGRAVTLQN